MAQVDEGQGFDHALSDLERLLGNAVDHEHRLTTLASRLEGDGRAELAPADSAGATSLLTTVRELCLAARDQRMMTEVILAGLAGDPSHTDAVLTPRPRVLIVDDSNDGRDMAATVLEAAGFHAIAASNGLEGVVVAHYARPAVVLMDLSMPVLDGIEAARLLKASDTTRHLKVIAYTATPDFLANPRARLFAGVLPKPASPGAIVSAVQRFAEPGAPATDVHAHS